MTLEKPDIPGAEQLVCWFGHWPSFHDAEVVSLSLNRAGPSTITIHCFLVTSEVDERGFYVNTHHALVTFAFDQITCSDLADFNHQNVISGLTVRTDGDTFQLVLGGCFGLQGSLSGKMLAVSFIPGKSDDGVYV